MQQSNSVRKYCPETILPVSIKLLASQTTERIQTDTCTFDRVSFVGVAKEVLKKETSQECRVIVSDGENAITVVGDKKEILIEEGAEISVVGRVRKDKRGQVVVIALRAMEKKEGQMDHAAMEAKCAELFYKKNQPVHLTLHVRNRRQVPMMPLALLEVATISNAREVPRSLTTSLKETEQKMAAHLREIKERSVRRNGAASGRRAAKRRNEDDPESGNPKRPTHAYNSPDNEQRRPSPRHHSPQYREPHEQADRQHAEQQGQWQQMRLHAEQQGQLQEQGLRDVYNQSSPQYNPSSPQYNQSSPEYRPQSVSPNPASNQSSPEYRPQSVSPNPAANQSSPEYRPQSVSPNPASNQSSPEYRPQSVSPNPAANQSSPEYRPRVSSNPASNQSSPEYRPQSVSPNPAYNQQSPEYRPHRSPQYEPDLPSRSRPRHRNVRR